MIIITAKTPMGEFKSVPLNTDKETVIKLLRSSEFPIDIELEDGVTIFICRGIVEQSLFFISEVNV